MFTTIGLAFTKFFVATVPMDAVPNLAPLLFLHASFSVQAWPSSIECCHTESSTPGAHLHITSLKQKSRRALMQDGCFLKWRTIFISVPFKAATIQTRCGFLTTFHVIPEATLRSGPLVGNICFSDFVSFTPWGFWTASSLIHPFLYSANTAETFSFHLERKKPRVRVFKGVLHVHWRKLKAYTFWS